MSEMNPQIERLVSFVKDRDLYVLFGVATVAELGLIFGFSSSSITAQLGIFFVFVFAIALLSNRYRSLQVLNEITTVTKNIASSIELNNKNSTQVMSEIVALQKELEELKESVQPKEIIFFDSGVHGAIIDLINSTTKTLWIITRTGGNTIQRYYGNLENKLEVIKGINIRIITCERNKGLFNILIVRGAAHRNLERLDGQSISGRSLIEELRGVGSGIVEHHPLPYIHPTTLFISDPSKEDNGSIVALIGAFQSSTYGAPYFKFTRQDNEKLFQFFVDDFDRCWNPKSRTIVDLNCVKMDEV